MARRKIPEISEVINQGNTKKFIGRNEELALFRQSFSEDLPIEDFKWIFNIHGQGGVGKTTLSKQYQIIAKKQELKVAFLDLEDRRLQNVPALLVEIVRQLKEQKIKFSEFDKKHKDFTETLKELAKDDKATPGLLSAIVSGSIKTGVSELKKIPGSGLLDSFNTDGLADKIGNYSTFLFNKFKDKGKQELMTEPNKVLTTAFLEDIDNCDDEVCLIFDTYETAFLSLDEWLRDIYQKKFGKTPNNLFLVISGRDELIDKWNEFSSITHKILLEQFTHEEAVAFLKSKNITNEIIIKTLVEISDRFPVLLSLFSENPPTSIEEINDVSGNAIERFLKWIKNPEERKVILAAALPRAINQDMVGELLAVLKIDNTKCQFYYDLLNKQPFVQQRGDIKTYHPVVKAQMLKYQFNTSPKTWREQHYILAKYFDAEAELLGFENLETKYTNDEWIRLTLEATYHKLCGNFEKELPSAVERMVIHLDRTRNEESAINWSQIISEAGKLVSKEKWSLFIQKGVNGLITKHGEIILEFFESFIINDWVKDKHALSLLYFYIGYYKPEHLIKEVIKNYEKAIEFNPKLEQAYNNLGNAYKDKGDFSKALRYYNHAILLNPKDTTAFYNLGNLYREDGKIHEAIEYYKKAISQKPTSELAYNNLGNIYKNINKTEKAIECYKKVIILNPNLHLGFYNLGNIYAKKQDFINSIKNYEKAIELNPNDENCLMNLGANYFFTKNIIEALRIFERLIQVNPKHILAHTNIGFINIRRGNYIEADQYIQKSWELSNLKNNYAVKNIAHLSLLQEDRKIAIEKYKAAIPLWDNLEEYLQQLERDYDHLLLEEKGISKSEYQTILEELKNKS